jgi:hypothetical protein
MAFIVEIAIAKARKKDSEVRIKNKQELLHVLIDKEAFSTLLEQGEDADEVSESVKCYSRENRISIVDYFMRIYECSIQCTFC